MPLISAKCTLFALAAVVLTQDARAQGGLLSFSSASFDVQLVESSQTLYSLKPASSSFDFVPSDMMDLRSNNGNYHLGDITFRARLVGSDSWVSADSSTNRVDVTPADTSGEEVAAADLTPTLPSGSLLSVRRRWVLTDEYLELLFDVTNTQSEAVEIGALGSPLEFNNIFTGRTSTETNEKCSVFDPYIGADAGYVQVTPLLGTLPPLLVVPANSISPLEGWRFLTESGAEEPYYQSQTFEGLYEWQFHTLSYAQNEWSGATPWNEPTSALLEPNATSTYGIRFYVAESIRNIEAKVIEIGRPVAVGIPGYILPADQTGKLFLNYDSPVSNISVSPSDALSWSGNADAASEGWAGYDIVSSGHGRSRLSITYEDGTLQTIEYYGTKAASTVVADLGNFLTTSQWFENPEDPFNRSPSVISYDREIDAIVKDDPRAWIPGLSDEAGAGSWLAAVMKQYVQPNADELEKLERFVNETLWPSLQYTDGRVKKSVYYYEPDLVPGYDYPSDIDFGAWWSWNRDASYATDRAYDYVHVTAAYWSMYRVSRNYPGLLSTSWEWYLSQALLTVTAMTSGGVGYVNVGLMGETVFIALLDDLKREGWSDDATALKVAMRARWEIWTAQDYPFGSEMAWDSTGQEGVYAWSSYFEDERTATNTINSIIAYQPLIAHWGYNGNARRYWDNIYGGKIMRVERQIHHYGSGLNALPLLSAFETLPTDYHLLRVGFAGVNAPLSNIDEGGFASAAFHSFPDTLKWDPYSGDYGPNFVGHALGTGTFIIDHPDFGWQAFGGNVIGKSDGVVTVQVVDAVRRRIFIAPIGALLTLDAGVFDAVTFNTSTSSVTVTIGRATAAGADATDARMHVEQTVESSGTALLKPTDELEVDAGAYTIPFNGSTVSVSLVYQ